MCQGPYVRNITLAYFIDIVLLLKLFAVTLSHDLLNRLFYFYFQMTFRILLSPLS